MQSRGRPVRPSSSGITSNERRASRNSPAPWTWEWLASTCSIKCRARARQAKDEHRPPASRAGAREPGEQVAVKLCDRPSTKRS